MTDNSRPDTMVIPSVRKAVKPYVDRALRYRWFGNDHYETWIPQTVE